MEKIDIIDIIDKKLAEHKYEVDMSMNLLDKYRLDIANSKKSISKANEEMVKDTMKLGILKDKIIFHRAAIAILEDLKLDIK